MQILTILCDFFMWINVYSDASDLFIVLLPKRFKCLLPSSLIDTGIPVDGTKMVHSSFEKLWALLNLSSISSSELHTEGNASWLNDSFQIR